MNELQSWANRQADDVIFDAEDRGLIPEDPTQADYLRVWQAVEEAAWGRFNAMVRNAGKPITRRPHDKDKR